MKVGNIIKLKVECLNNLIGSIGVCYETYNIGKTGAGSIIFENGEFDGFAPNEQSIFLEEVGHSEQISNYTFTNVMKLSDDFRDGMFNSVLNKK